MVKKKLEKIIYSIEKEFDLIDKVDIRLDKGKYDKQSISFFKDNIYHIVVGIKDYQDMEKLTDKQFNHVCNTILHELIHARNFFELSNGMRSKLLEKNRRTLQHYAWKMLDEYSAYMESNQQFKENADELNGTVDDAFKGFLHMSQGTLVRATEEEFYDAFYDYCSAIIARYCVDKELFLSCLEEEYECMVENFLMHLRYSYDQRPLSYEQYESLGRRLIYDLLEIIPRGKQHFFKYNTHITNLK